MRLLMRKRGFFHCSKIIPYLVAILVAVGGFCGAGAMDMLMSGLERLCLACGLDADFIPALPTALMKPLSGSGARGLMIDTITRLGRIPLPDGWLLLSKGPRIRLFTL